MPYSVAESSRRFDTAFKSLIIFLLLLVSVSGCGSPRDSLFLVRETQLKELVKFYHSSRLTRLEADARMDLSLFYYEHGHTGESATEAYSAARLYEQTGLSSQRFNALRTAAVSKQEAGDITGALDLLDELLVSADREDNDPWKRDCYRFLATIHQSNTGEIDKAISYIEKALSSARTAGNCHSELELLNDFGSILQTKGDLLRTIETWTRALEISRITGNYQSEKIFLEHLASSTETAGLSEETEFWLAEGIAASVKTRDILGEMSFLLTLSRVRRERGDIKNGFEPARQALTLSSRAEMKELQGAALKELSLLHRQVGEYDSCRQALEQAADLYENANLPGSQAVILQDLFDLDIAVGRSESALDFALEALELYDDLHDWTNGASLAARILPVFAEMKGIRQAEEFLRPRIQAQRDRKDRTGEASLRTGLSWVLLGEGDLEGSRREAEAALEIYETGGMLLQRLSTLDLLAYIYERQADYEAAIELRSAIISIQAGSGLKAEELAQRSRLRDLYNSTGDTIAAEAELRRMLELARHTGNSLAEAGALLSHAATFQAKGDYDGALEALLEVEQLHRRAGDLRGLADIRMRAAALFWETGVTDRAVDACTEALELYSRMGDRSRKLNCLNILGSYYQDSGQLGKAEDTHRRALETAETIGLPDGIIYSLKNVGNVLTARGDYTGAAGVYTEGARKAEAAFLPNAEQELLEKCIMVYDTLNQPVPAGDQLVKLAELKLRRGDPGGAALSFSEAVSRLTAAGETARAATLEKRLLEITGSDSSSAAPENPE